MSASLGATETGREKRPVFVKVWDPVVRLFHWSLVLSFAVAMVTAEEWDTVHEYAGYAVAALVGLRIVWGFVGTRHARFADFVYRPSEVVRYVKDTLALRARRYLGHNPAGGAMIVVLLLCLVGVSATGILLGADTYKGLKWLEEVHEVLGNLCIGLVVLHIGGVVFSSFEHGENLVRSMVDGLKRSDY